MPDHYEIHPITDLFPGMLPEEFELFKEDVRANGLREPIVLFEKRIIDGRHRQRACDETGTPARYRGWSGSPQELLAYVVSTNLRRRHLTEQQRALIAVKLSKYGHGGARKGDQEANLPLDRLTRATAAKLMDVSHRTVTDAAKVIDQGAPALVEAVRSGKVAVSTAAALADQPPAVQQEIVARGEKEIIAKAKAIKETRSAARQEKRINDLSARAAEFELEPVTGDDIRIICADARTMLDHVRPGSMQLVVTSPPYNVGMPYLGYSDTLPENEYRDLLGSVFSRCAIALQDGGRMAVVVPLGVDRNPYKPFAPFVHDILVECGFAVRGEIVWDKGDGVGAALTSWGSHRSFTNPSLRDRVEIILVMQKGNATLTAPAGILREDVKGKYSPFLQDPNYFSELTQNLWKVQPETRFSDVHPAPFSWLLAQRLIHLYAFPGALIGDPFMGTGSTLVAAKKNGCRAVGFDLSKDSCAIAKARLEKEGESLT